MCLCLLVTSTGPVASAEPDNDPGRIQSAYDRGDYRAVVSALEASMPDGRPSIHSSGQIRWLLMNVDAYRKLGMHVQATDLLVAVRPDIESHERRTESHALYYGRLGEAYGLEGDAGAAVAAIERGLAIASAQNLVSVEAGLQNALGNVYTAANDGPRGIAAYRRGLSSAVRAGVSPLIATTAINLARALLDRGNVTDVRATLDTARQAVGGMSEGAEKLAHRLALGRLYQTAQQSLGFSAEFRAASHEQLSAAMQLAERLDNDRSLSYALGYLGSLYEEERRVGDAKRLTERAIHFGYRAGADEALYLWEWQLARLQLQDGRPELALASYRRAVRSVDRIRTSLVARSTDVFRRDVVPLYFELADLLLQRTATLTDPDDVQANLVDVRQTLENLKTVEIIEYFDNECVIQAQDRTALERLSATAAIVYPILTTDRLELLVSFPNDIRQVTVPVDRDTLTREIRQLRVQIEDAGSGEGYLPAAQSLYDSLLRPIEDLLTGNDVDTLVIVPDGPLRTIPLSVLHDGRQFLIEKYALATTPGISLTSAAPINREDVHVLAYGITEAVQGFPALPNVADELHGIQRLYPTQLNQDERFRLRDVERSISDGEYSIVHIATHGQFESDHRDSFLLTYNDRMTLDRLEESLNLRRYEQDAVELLVLSACQTAAGDDRAALGMAGIALKAGARSALATLWFINDASTSALMQDFYAYLKSGDMSKAEALQRAQLDMLVTAERRHPAHWAPFLLIGNWL